MKKAADTEKKLAEKQDKAREKARTKGQTSLDIRRLAMNNRQAVEVGTFKDILSDPPMATNETDEGENAEKTAPNEVPLAVRRTLSDKKKNKAQALASRLIAKGSSSKAPRQSRPQTPPPVAMELIRPGKRRVRVPSNAVESTPPKRMRKVRSEENLDEN